MTEIIRRAPATTSERVWLRISAFLSLKSPATRVTYSGIITEWCRFLGSEPGTLQAAQQIISATDLHAIAYRKHLETQPGEKPRFVHGASAPSSDRRVTLERAGAGGRKKDGLDATLSNATIHKKFAALRRIYRMLLASNLGIVENPFEVDKVPPPPKDAGRKRPTQMVEFDRVMEIVSVPDPSTPKGRRDRAILAILFGGGLRRSEVVALRLGDVRRTSSGTTYLYLRYTKAKRDAQQALPGWAAELLWSYLAERRAAGAGDADYLFVSFTGQAGKTATSRQISDTGVYLLFKQSCIAAGAGEFATPHSARATAITKLLADGVPHREVQEFSRHSSIQMVEWYDKRRFDIEQSPAKNLSFERKRRP
jgi:site-specific recombinase XerD